MTLTPLAGGFCFGEGPRWFENLVWFSDMLGEAVHTVTLDGRMSTLELPGHSPSGLGFCPDGALLIVSTEQRQVLRYDGESVEVYADLGDVVPAALGDMVVDSRGTAFVGSQAREGGVIVRLDPGGARAGGITVVAHDLEFPNGMVLTPDGSSLIVAESVARRLTSFSVDTDQKLTNRAVFADGLAGPPDGICLDADGGIWAALTLAHEFVRVVSDGGDARVTERIGIGDRAAIACTLGGPEDRTLFLVSAADAYPERLRGTTLGRLEATTVDVPAAPQP